MVEELLLAEAAPEVPLSTRNRRFRSSRSGGDPIELRAGTPSRSIPAQPGDCTDSMGTGRWFESAFMDAPAAATAAARSSLVMNWMGRVASASDAWVLVPRPMTVATRRHRYAPNSPSTTMPINENESRKYTYPSIIR
uniref:(northern house mosquito) hypothetical protein n=1 Tax=Culex pipiens TaxID=7175 RepID=A0A8D8FHI6_CULPI